MGAAFIIINNAIKQRNRLEEEEKKKIKLLKEEKSMREKGFVKTQKLINPNSCYRHFYKDVRKRKTGLLMMLFSAISIALGLLFLGDESLLKCLIVGLGIIFLLIGRSNFFNQTEKWSEVREPKVLDGYHFDFTNYKPIFVDEWVSSKK